MLVFVLRRLLNLVPVFFGSTILVFLILQAAPGDFLDSKRLDPRTKPETIERLERQFGLDQPALVQYGYWVRNLLSGDLGTSFAFDRPVSEIIARPVQNSMILVIGNIILLYLLAIPIGVYGAVRQYSASDKAISLASYFFLGFPTFFLSLIIIYLLLQYKFATGNFFLPVGGMTSDNFDQLSPWGQFWDIAWHAAAPLFAATLGDIAGFTRFMRGQMLEFLSQDYIRTARSKGLSERAVVYKHALRNAVTPFIAGVGGILPGLIGGAGFVEFVFNWPGITPVIIQAVTSQDLYLYVGFLAITLLLLIVGNIVSDVLLAVVDPRIRYN